MQLFAWVELHGAITHMPLAFLLAAPVFEIGAAVMHKPQWRTVSFYLLVCAVITAIPAVVTGWITGNDLGYTGASHTPPPIFVHHRLAAFTTTCLSLALLWWRVHTADRFSRRAHLGSMSLGLLAAATVAYTGFLGGRMVFGSPQSAQMATAEKSATAPSEVPAAVPAAAPALPRGATPQLVAKGEKLFHQLPCLSCHRFNGGGGHSGPDLSHEARRHADVAWHVAHLKDPSKYKADSGMPPFDDLPASQLQALAAFLATRR